MTGLLAPQPYDRYGGKKQQAFFEPLIPHAKKFAKATGLDPSLALAVAALESGWDKDADTLFGIKGPGKELQTTEYENGEFVPQTASFRTYDGPGAAFEDFAKLLSTDERYIDLMSSAGKPLEDQVAAFHASPYATDKTDGRRQAILSIARNIDPSLFRDQPETAPQTPAFPGISNSVYGRVVDPDPRGMADQVGVSEILSVQSAPNEQRASQPEVLPQGLLAMDPQQLTAVQGDERRLREQISQDLEAAYDRPIVDEVPGYLAKTGAEFEVEDRARQAAEQIQAAQSPVQTPASAQLQPQQPVITSASGASPVQDALTTPQVQGLLGQELQEKSRIQGLLSDLKGSSFGQGVRGLLDRAADNPLATSMFVGGLRQALGDDPRFAQDRGQQFASQLSQQKQQNAYKDAIADMVEQRGGSEMDIRMARLDPASALKQMQAKEAAAAQAQADAIARQQELEEQASQQQFELLKQDRGFEGRAGLEDLKQRYSIEDREDRQVFEGEKFNAERIGEAADLQSAQAHDLVLQENKLQAEASAGPSSTTFMNVRDVETGDIQTFRADDPRINEFLGNPAYDVLRPTSDPAGTGNGLAKSTAAALERGFIDNAEIEARLDQIMDTYQDGKFLTYRSQARAAALEQQARLGLLPPNSDGAAYLRERAAFKQSVTNNVNRYIKEITGAAMSNQEAVRIEASVPSLKDDAVTFKAKLDQFRKYAKAASRRKQYLLENGVDHDFAAGGEPPLPLEQFMDAKANDNIGDLTADDLLGDVVAEDEFAGWEIL